MIIGSIKEHNPEETRVALTPAVTTKLITAGHRVFIEEDSGQKAGFSNEKYQKAGAEILSPKQIYQKSNIILQIQPPKTEIMKILKRSQILVADFRNNNTKNFSPKCTIIRLDLVPRISVAQSIDILSAQNTVRGYMGALYALSHAPRIAPQLMTAAASIKAAETLVIGAGVTGLQAASLFKRIGCRVTIMDINMKSKELAASVGAEFVLAQNPTEISLHLKNKNFIFTAAAISNGKSPQIITAEHLSLISDNTVLIDTTSGNIEITDETAQLYPFYFYRNLYFERLAPITASELWANNMQHLIRLISPDTNKFDLDIKYLQPMIQLHPATERKYF